MAVGINLAKNVFSVNGIDEHGKVVLQRTLRRDQLTEVITMLPQCEITKSRSQASMLFG